MNVEGGSNNMNKFLTLAVMGFTILGGSALAQDEDSGWEIPPEATAVENPVENTPDAIAAGEALYGKHCKMCHGDTGKGDGAATKFIKPAPHDISTAEVRDANTDGDIFYKITTGKRPMPSMQRKLSEEERWQVILFVRTLQAN
ncbi:MAG: hypothetical protein BMS9Abin37_1253 [Acidobacteriota bacterium]|nr:MAG: hypothetical protein BMS9Abin37_1253 [Acidobacteriota bacterium]